MNIWVPPSHYDRQVSAVRNAVREYDPDLDFGRNEESGQWCIFLKQGTNEVTAEKPLPVLGFNEIPHPDDALRRLYNSDARRRGLELLDSIKRHNDALERERDYRAKERSDELAEAMEYGFRKQGKHPFARIFVPGGANDLPDGGPGAERERSDGLGGAAQEGSDSSLDGTGADGRS